MLFYGGGAMQIMIENWVANIESLRSTASRGKNYSNFASGLGWRQHFNPTCRHGRSTHNPEKYQTSQPLPPSLLLSHTPRDDTQVPKLDKVPLRESSLTRKESIDTDRKEVTSMRGCHRFETNFVLSGSHSKKKRKETE
ncbi:hypothetical protein TNCV_2850801 [Trichonephila clavipes]|nr:hypothetical protein TNCV_2850801 [Trichonephila clavipes]